MTTMTTTTATAITSGKNDGCLVPSIQMSSPRVRIYLRTHSHSHTPRQFEKRVSKQRIIVVPIRKNVRGQKQPRYSAQCMADRHDKTLAERFPSSFGITETNGTILTGPYWTGPDRTRWGRACSLFASVSRPLTTHTFADGAPCLRIMETPPTSECPAHLLPYITREPFDVSYLLLVSP